MVAPECISLLLSYTYNSTVNCNEHPYGRTLYLHLLYSVVIYTSWLNLSQLIIFRSMAQQS